MGSITLKIESCYKIVAVYEYRFNSHRIKNKIEFPATEWKEYVVIVLSVLIFNV